MVPASQGEDSDGESLETFRVGSRRGSFVQCLPGRPHVELELQSHGFHLIRGEKSSRCNICRANYTHPMAKRTIIPYLIGLYFVLFVCVRLSVSATAVKHGSPLPESLANTKGKAGKKATHCEAFNI